MFLVLFVIVLYFDCGLFRACYERLYFIRKKKEEKKVVWFLYQNKMIYRVETEKRLLR